MAAGYKVGVHNNSAGNITVARATGGDTINGAAKNIVIPAQQRLNFRVNAAANGYLIEGPTGGIILDPTDPSKQAKWDISGVTTGTVVTLTPPAAGGTLITSSSLTAANGASMVYLGSKTASASASLTFTSSDFSWSTYQIYVFELVNILPATNAADLQQFFSQDGGGTWKTGANYDFGYNAINSNNARNDLGGASSASPRIPSVSNSSTYQGVSGSFRIVNPSGTSARKRYFGSGTSTLSTGPYTESMTFAQTYTADTAAINGIQWIFSAGAITSGQIHAYGIRTS